MRSIVSNWKYFDLRVKEVKKFWTRFDSKPDFTNKIVADVGCGFGPLTIDIGLSGADKVIGFDINNKAISFAKENLRINYPNLMPRVEFRNEDIRNYSKKRLFDYIVSFSAFEHIIDLEKVLNKIKCSLKRDGQLYVGLGPLWRSPFGDHGLLNCFIPWGHLFSNKSNIIDKVNKTSSHNKKKLINDLNLNMLSLVEYKRMFIQSGLKIRYYQENKSNNLVLKLFELLKFVPFLNEYLTHNIYCVLEK